MKRTFDIEGLIGNIDGTNRELYLVGDMSTNLLPGVAYSNSSKLINVCETFGLGSPDYGVKESNSSFSIPN